MGVKKRSRKLLKNAKNIPISIKDLIMLNVLIFAVLMHKPKCTLPSLIFDLENTFAQPCFFREDNTVITKTNLTEPEQLL